MDWMTNPEAWIAFATLLALEIVLGIDNVVFISILAGNCRQTSRLRRAILDWHSRW
jgi:predicted tellurium resistance membrane protein TerC